MTWPFKKRAAVPLREWVGAESFGDWTEDDITFVSRAIRAKNGQPEHEGFRRFARVALNTLRGASVIELVARAMEESANPGSDADAPISERTGHYMAGMPRWCMWVEFARPAVEALAKRPFPAPLSNKGGER